jgi:hypothetical protein
MTRLGGDVGYRLRWRWNSLHFSQSLVLFATRDQAEENGMKVGRTRTSMAVAALGLACAIAVGKTYATEIPPQGQETPAPAPAIPAHGPAVVLFDGKDLSGFDTFLKSKGLNSDPEHVFKVEDGVVHISGTEFGYIITKQSFHDYYLRAEFKWGVGTFGERAGMARDSGILYNIQGEQKVWPQSIEFQVTEGGTGDFWMTDGAALTGRDGVRVTGPAGGAKKIDRFGKGPSKNVTGFRDPVGEVEKPYGEWNVLELVTQGNTVKQYVNGKLVNEGTDPFPKEGKILFQSEGAEVFFRNMTLYPLK